MPGSFKWSEEAFVLKAIWRIVYADDGAACLPNCVCTADLSRPKSVCAEKLQKRPHKAPESFGETAQLIDTWTESAKRSYGRVFVTWENSEITLLIMGVKDWPLNRLIGSATVNQRRLLVSSQESRGDHRVDSIQSCWLHSIGRVVFSGIY